MSNLAQFILTSADAVAFLYSESVEPAQYNVWAQVLVNWQTGQTGELEIFFDPSQLNPSDSSLSGITGGSDGTNMQFDFYGPSDIGNFMFPFSPNGNIQEPLSSGLPFYQKIVTITGTVTSTTAGPLGICVQVTQPTFVANDVSLTIVQLNLTPAT